MFICIQKLQVSLSYYSSATFNDLRIKKQLTIHGLIKVDFKPVDSREDYLTSAQSLHQCGSFGKD